MRLLPAALLALAAASPAQAQTLDRARLSARVDSLVAAALRAGPVAGMSVAVVKGRDTLVMKGYGLADLENDAAATPATVYRIGSVTKQFTASAVMQLVEQGRVGLDDEITKYFPGFPTHGQRILVRHLLNHTSGIPSYTDIGPRWSKLITLDLPHDSVLALVKNDSLLFAPGAGYYYNNTGYYMLGMLIEKVTGRPYAEYMAEHLFAPLGLQSTRYCATEPVIKHRAQGYEVERGTLVNASYLNMGQAFSAGALCSTVGDLVRWEAAIMGGRVVSATSLARMTTPAKLTSSRPMHYGYGLARDSLGRHPRIGHGGGINGFISELDYYPRDSLTVAVLANTAPAPSSEVAESIARLVFGMPPDSAPPKKVVALGAAERARYVGAYAMQRPDATRTPARVLDDGGQLVMEADGDRLRLVPLGADVFTVEGRPGSRVYFTVANGTATELLLSQYGRPLAAVRVR